MRLLIAILFIINLLVLIFALSSNIPTKSNTKQWEEISPEKILKIDNLANLDNKSSTTLTEQNNTSPLLEKITSPPVNLLTNNQTTTNASNTPTPPSATLDKNSKQGNCTAWKGLTRKDEELVVASLANISGISRERIASPRGSTWLVYVPINNTFEDTQANLNAKGIRDGIRAQNQISGAEIISLGFYATEGAAEIRVREVSRAGISDVRIGPRQKNGGYSVQVKANSLAELLKASNAVAKKLPNIDVSECN